MLCVCVYPKCSRSHSTFVISGTKMYRKLSVSLIIFPIYEVGTIFTLLTGQPTDLVCVFTKHCLYIRLCAALFMIASKRAITITEQHKQKTERAEKRENGMFDNKI